MLSGDILQKFQPASAVEIKEVVMKSPNKSSDVDHMSNYFNDDDYQ